MESFPGGSTHARIVVVLSAPMLHVYALPAYFAGGYPLRSWNRGLSSWGASAAVAGLLVIHVAGPDMPS